MADETGGCLICEGKTRYFFSKVYPTFSGSPFKCELKVDYHKCQNCGFVISRTHQEMSPAEWSGLNASWHHNFESDIDQRTTNQPPYAEQALALRMLSINGLVDLGDALDYAAGYGTLYKFLRKYLDVRINIFDRYVHNDEDSIPYVGCQDLKKYRLVINSAMFEHVLTREALDEVNSLVADDGVLMLHTLVCENVPEDPDWFYLTPMVHTAFHTNASMELLMRQWGYSHSVYSPTAKSWFLFKEGYQGLDKLTEKISLINREVQSKYFYHKQGFVDYWKGF